MPKRKMTPEERAAFRAELEGWAEDRRQFEGWAEDRRQFAVRVEEFERHLRAERERWERRRRRINRLSLGLLARPDATNAS
jgi:hypothetical protein